MKYKRYFQYCDNIILGNDTRMRSKMQQQQQQCNGHERERERERDNVTQKLITLQTKDNIYSMHFHS